jgi:hypothetical protein
MKEQSKKSGLKKNGTGNTVRLPDEAETSTAGAQSAQNGQMPKPDIYPGALDAQQY